MLAKPSLVCDCSPCWLLTVIKMFGLLCHVSVKNPENKSYSLRWKVLWNSSSGWLVCIYSFWCWTIKKHPLHLRGAITIRLCRITTGLGWGLHWQKRHFEYWSRIRSNMMFRKIYWSKMREKLFVKLLIIFLIPSYLFVNVLCPAASMLGKVTTNRLVLVAPRSLLPLGPFSSALAPGSVLLLSSVFQSNQLDLLSSISVKIIVISIHEIIKFKAC